MSEWWRRKSSELAAHHAVVELVSKPAVMQVLQRRWNPRSREGEFSTRRRGAKIGLLGYVPQVHE